MSGEGSLSTERLDTEDGLKEETFCQTVTSCRWTLSYVGFLCFTLIYALRVNMGIAIVCMVKAANNTMENSSTGDLGGLVEDECFSSITNTSTADSISGDIEWDKTTQGWILSSYFYGYIITQIPSGWLSGRFGGKRVMLGGLIVYGVCTILTPVASRYDGQNSKVSAILLIMIRAIAGLAAGFVFPAMHNLLGRWSPPYERSKLTVTCFSGATIGTVFMLGLGGFFCEWTSFDGGWPSMFYVGGGMCLLFCLVWMFTVYDTPEEHPRISKRELHFIQRSLKGTKKGVNTYVPWRKIMTSPAMWAIIIAHFCDNVGDYTLATKLPAFMKEVLNYDIKSNGLYSSLPYILMALIAHTACHIIDKLRKKRLVTTTMARKIAMILAFVIPAGLLVSAGYIPCGKSYIGVVILTVAVGFTGFRRSGYNPNPQDIGHRYAGEIFAISNAFATIPGMVSPLLVNAMTSNGTAKEWRNVFYVWASVYVFGAIMYTILARGETQDWALDKEDQHGQQSGKCYENTTQEDFSLGHLQPREEGKEI